MRRILIDLKEGSAEGMHALIDVLQTEGMKRTTQRVLVKGPEGRLGEVRLSRGAVYSVSAGEASGPEALQDILSWGIEEIEVEDEGGADVIALDESCCPVNQLLLEIAETVTGLVTLGAGQEGEDESMRTVEDKLRGVLRNMVDRLGGVEGCMLVDAEGFVIADHGASVEGDEEVELVGGITTSLLTENERDRRCVEGLW